MNPISTVKRFLEKLVSLIDNNFNALLSLRSQQVFQLIKMINHEHSVSPLPDSGLVLEEMIDMSLFIGICLSTCLIK